MTDISIRIEGRAGRITLTRPQALNALSETMGHAIHAALDDWRDNDAVALVILEAEGDRAFCAGGDIVDLYHAAKAGQYDFGRTFWADEYRMNLAIATYPKPVVSFLQGYTMGGGVGVGCHGSHRVVGETSQIAMPECAIGLITDVGGTFLLARAPGHIGEYLGTTAARMGPEDAIYAGFADFFVPEDDWDTLKSKLVETGDVAALAAHLGDPPPGDLVANRAVIDRHFGADSLGDVVSSLAADMSEISTKALKGLRKSAPLAACTTLALIRAQRAAPGMPAALTQEYRAMYRLIAHADMVEGIRAAIIDKDRNPAWTHDSFGKVPADEVAGLMAPLGDKDLDLGGTA